ncbi:fumarylacetoacetate hydrolase family protein [Boudabousia marimammalium]|uniref:2-hydroxyhepta-2,4-diene-1,7-dioate isomerase n=1 Tax=Boudabousia marimammalium TaxID=156892 RepID=A0A1Q5PP57_9ACTO|nr:fumarylacetoacetate hydrolase family protein [Boudabousia marimammalium]OKL49364.1 hypothetical protein BM477_05165 [Boudabousia marimammalium]
MRVLRFRVGNDIHYGVMEDGSHQVIILKGDPMYSAIEPSGQILDFDDIRLLSPVIPRSKVICAAPPANAFDPGVSLDFYLKPNTAVIGPDDPIVIPTWAESVAGRVRLAAVIKTMCKDLTEDQVDDAVFGWTIVNDVEAFTADGRQHNLAAHGFDTACPIGPWIVVNPELELDNLHYSESVNEEVVSTPRHSVLPFSPRAVVAAASQLTTLLPGDVVVSGCLSNPVNVRAQDRMECTIEGLGTLSNMVLSR